MPFTFEKLKIPDVLLITAHPFQDARGFFMETYKMSEFSANGMPQAFCQDNFSWSARGVLRGLHFQKAPAAQGKLVTALYGEILDVAVDIRKGSPTFGRWVSERLSAENHRMLYVPQGFAHGFCTLSEHAGVFYKVTSEYSREHDRGIAWNDPDIAVDWMIREPVLSEKDSALPLLKDSDTDFIYGTGGLATG